MNGKYDLTEGPISPALMKLTLPIIATNFISTTYGLIDMIWIGRLGSGPVAAVGTAIFYVNLAVALFTIISIGTGIKVAHSIGAGKEEEAQVYIHNAFLMSLFLSILYMVFIIFAKTHLIGYFELDRAEIEQMASQYLLISIAGTVFSFFNILFSTVFTSMGNSERPFRVQTVGFLVNLILDPLLIFGIGPIQGLGVSGAASATLLANVMVTVLFILYAKNLRFLPRPYTFNMHQIKEVLRLGGPITVQRVTFIFISIIIAKIIAQWGPDAIAAQRVGIQIESISYMTIGGLQGAIAAFIGQNFGAHKHDRIKKGYQNALWITVIFGSLISLLFILLPGQIFSLFLSDKTSLMLGTDYMRIIGFSQLFMCLELMTVGAFNGIGKTYIPPIFSIILTALRIPMAIVLSGPFGLNGVWMSIAISSVLKGIILVFWYLRTLGKITRELKVGR
ncbi:MATE family efflux transporter [Ammoniphilus resinae]|uniref:Probable multidrug resistance protein NorM n=1 Tax=Ammoniphilus resinae TaxID=861532 RepID=A0ABS4GR80_9BACL|nr:MATE family efflux transporter [Ammoniphilus resinae]MBP1932761.1 putative MATE family efflux protein [Ammoniphilus resinae]